MTATLSTSEALRLILDQVDYTAGACNLTELVGAVLPEDVIATCRQALAAEPSGPTIGELLSTAPGEAIVRGNDAFLIWSHEHAMWWAPRENGYTAHVEAAGVYPWARAKAICERAGWSRGSAPPEIPVRLSDVRGLQEPTRGRS